MSSKDVAISVRNLSKSYTIAHNAAKHSTMGEALMHRLKNPVQRVEKETFWALKDVSFDIQKGDVVGIIGRNGAGKSTLLKVLSRITEPTSGKAIMNGRVGSLLEVGTGFHPELTGRENIYLNGAVLGLTRREIARQFDAIVDFAGVEQFLDTPVKRYSSGMYVRLAFAVAAHLPTEILVIDEVLAVGDAEFQKKCLGKMEDAARSGRTVLFVSHNLEIVRKLCHRGILLSHGETLLTGPIQQVLDRYIEHGVDAQAIYNIDMPPDRSTPAYAYKIQVEDVCGKPINEIPVGRQWQIRVFFKITKRIEGFVVGLGILTPYDFPLRTTWSPAQTLDAGDYEAVFVEDTILLEPGRYPLLIGLSSGGFTFHYVDKAGILQIADVAELSDSDDVNFVKLSNCGIILNPLKVSISHV